MSLGVDVTRAAFVLTNRQLASGRLVEAWNKGSIQAGNVVIRSRLPKGPKWPARDQPDEDTAPSNARWVVRQDTVICT